MSRLLSPVFPALLARDLRLALRRRQDLALPLAFVALATALFPLGVGPEPGTLRQVAPGIAWVAALLAGLLSVQGQFAGDLADGTLDQLRLADPGALATVTAKACAHWLLTGAPLVLAGPVAAASFGLPGPSLALMAATLALGTPALSLLGTLGAALSLGLRGGAMLLVLLVLPLATPVLVFGAGAVSALEAGAPAGGALSLLAATTLFTGLVAVPGAAAALRLAVE